MWHQILNFFFPTISVVPMAFKYNFFYWPIFSNGVYTLFECATKHLYNFKSLTQQGLGLCRKSELFQFQAHCKAKARSLPKHNYSHNCNLTLAHSLFCEFWLTFAMQSFRLGAGVLGFPVPKSRFMMAKKVGLPRPMSVLLWWVSLDLSLITPERYERYLGN